MPETLSDTFDAPIPATAGGKSHELPLLDMDDLSALGRQVFQAAKAKRLRQLPLTASQAERDNIIRFYDDQEADVDTLARWVFTLPGATAFIVRSLKKLSVPEPEAVSWIKRHARENGWQMGTAALAARISGLFPPKTDDKAGQTGNPPMGEADGSTGNSADASSSESADKPPGG